MLNEGGLELADGRLVLGPKAETRFGRKTFMELYAVFSSPRPTRCATPCRKPSRIA
jgi:ATP-dependent Lhr-like helicase